MISGQDLCTRRSGHFYTAALIVLLLAAGCVFGAGPSTPGAVPTAGRVNIAQAAGLTQTEAIEIAQFTSATVKSGYTVRTTIRDPQTIAQWITVLNNELAVGQMPACIADYELRFKRADGVAATFGYMCRGKESYIIRGATSDRSFVLAGEVQLPDQFKTLVEAALVKQSMQSLYPLSLGATWVYSATIDYQENSHLLHWSGTITETITNVSLQGDARIFEAEKIATPAVNSNWIRPRRYVLMADRLFDLSRDHDLDKLVAARGQGFDGVLALMWPLTVGQRWGDAQFMARGDGWYVWQVEEQESVGTEKGNLADCYRVVFRTNPDHTMVWYCPGVGPARREYHHHGSVFDQVWALREFRAGR